MAAAKMHVLGHLARVQPHMQPLVLVLLLLPLTQHIGVGAAAPSRSLTMYEIALERTREAVARGEIADPASLYPLGSLLDEPLELVSDDADAEGEGGRRELKGDTPWYSMGASLSSNPGLTMADINSTAFRYDSVTPLSFVDWRLSSVMTPIQRQYKCQSCWAMAAVDSLAIITAIASNSMLPVPLSTQQICDCTSSSCCDGGWPEDAYAYILANGNITSSDAYPYMAVDRPTCDWNSSYPAAAKITGWELVPSYNQTALMKAVTMHPVLAFISASSPDFQTYNSFGQVNVYNGNCTREINHAVLVVGYNLTGQYWIIKNTWPRTWGDGGYMYIAMQDGAGKCGMQILSPMYPVNYPTAPQQTKVRKGSKFPVPADDDDGKWWKSWGSKNYDACVGIINPCGGGRCKSDNGIARCECPNGFTELVGVPTSRCITQRPCNAFINPCGAGVCRDSSDGTYTCRCNASYVLGARADGSLTCVLAASSSTTTYVTQYGDTCARVQAAYKINSTTFAALNSFINCSSTYLLPGIVVSINSSTSTGCNSAFTVRNGDTCDKIVLDNSITRTVLQALNPLLDCSNMFTGQLVCVNGTTNAGAAASPLVCKQSNMTVFGDTCSSVSGVYGINVDTLTRLNPGLDCSKPLPMGIFLCVASGTSSMVSSCTLTVRVQQGDTCPLLWNAWNLTMSAFLAINPGIQCQAPYLQVGQQVCVNSPLVAQMANQTTQLIAYRVQPSDTFAYIMSLFVYRCTPTSLTLANILAANPPLTALSTLVTNSTLIIPCVPTVRASCGCTASIPQCGNDYQPYSSYCDANCNYALPTRNNPTGPNPECNTCQLACMNRAGLQPNPPSACPANTICGYPVWPPTTPDALQITGTYTGALCNYFTTTCDNTCKDYAGNISTTQTYTANYNACNNMCKACHRAPCGGPSVVLPSDASIALNTACNTTATNCDLSAKICTRSPYNGYYCQSCNNKGCTVSCSVYPAASPLP